MDTPPGFVQGSSVQTGFPSGIAQADSANSITNVEAKAATQR
ncbi:MAG: hypothetical protein PHS80_07170 [Methanothrix sp.]|nr:hypothetical protein [Methanothrix sp.]